MRGLFLAAVAALAMSFTAHAAPISATGAVAIVNVTTDPAGVSIDQNTQFTFGFSLFSSGTGDLSIVPIGSNIVTQTITATLGSVVQFVASWGSFAGVVEAVNVSGDPSNRVVDVVAMGVFTPDAGPPDLTAFDPGDEPDLLRDADRRSDCCRLGVLHHRIGAGAGTDEPRAFRHGAGRSRPGRPQAPGGLTIGASARGGRGASGHATAMPVPETEPASSRRAVP